VVICLRMINKADNALVPNKMEESDLEEILEIEAVSFASPWTRNMFLDELSNVFSRTIVFRECGVLVGYMCFWSVLDEAHLLNIAVSPSHRGRGLGRQIMAYLEDTCRGRGLAKIVLEVARRNTPARRLYKKFGFHSIGFRRMYYTAEKDDALVMQKDIGAEKSDSANEAGAAS
jgi:ribosomal-protein-alanine N-acetyltransferase